MRLPLLPQIPEAFIDRKAARPLKGEIRPGTIFAWEPDLSHARELVIVTKVEAAPPRVWSRNLDAPRFEDGGGFGHYNDESRFREACWRTYFRDQTP